MATTNAFEFVARQRKVKRLVRHITELFDALHMYPERDGQLMADLLRAWGDAEWNAACVNIGMAPPKGNKPLCSIVTRLAVLVEFVGAQEAAS